MSDTNPSQTWSAEKYAANAAFVPALGAPALELLAPRPGERILDLGCGDGALTEQLAASGAEVVGVDASAELLEAAARRGLAVRQMNGHALSFDREFDAVFSNAALHWMQQPALVVEGVRRALKPGGRFVGEFGGFGNVAAITTAIIASLEAEGIDGAARMPWYFPTDRDYASLLEAHGFTVRDIALIARPTPLPTGLMGWLSTFASPFLKGLDEADAERVLARAAHFAETSIKAPDGTWYADYVRLRFSSQL